MFLRQADLDEAIRSSATKDLVAHLAKGEAIGEEDMGAGSRFVVRCKKACAGSCSSWRGSSSRVHLALGEVLRAFGR